MASLVACWAHSVRWAVAQGIADPARVCIYGASYGGYAALQSQVLDPDLYKAVIAVAPVCSRCGVPKPLLGRSFTT